MSKTIKMSLLFGALFFTMGLMTSCSESDEVTLESTQEYVIGSIDAIEAQGKIGRLGCYEFVFPITVNFPDESTASADSYEALRDIISTWKEENPDAEEKPELDYPVDLTSEDGEVISAESREELKEIRQECRREFRKERRRNFFKRACFDLVYPVSIEFPDGSTLEAESGQAIKTAIRAWIRATDPPRDNRPMLVFPVTVEYEDGSQATADSAEALRELKDQCEAEGE